MIKTFFIVTFPALRGVAARADAAQPAIVDVTMTVHAAFKFSKFEQHVSFVFPNRLLIDRAMTFYTFDLSMPSAQRKFCFFVFKTGSRFPAFHGMAVPTWLILKLPAVFVNVAGKTV